MGFGLGRGRRLDDAPGVVGISSAEMPALPDTILAQPESGRIDPRRWFPDPSRPLEIEVGSGKGGFLLQEAAAHPDVNYLGIEQAGEFYAYCADRIRRRGLANVRMLHTDATEFLHWRCPAGVVRVFHLYFSDPWPKRKHHKNRVVQDLFLADVWRTLVPGGELRVVTDHDELWAWCTEHFERWTTPGGAIPDDLRGRFHLPAQPFARRDFVPPVWGEEGELVGTNYERKMSAERPAHACVLLKSGDSAG